MKPDKVDATLAKRREKYATKESERKSPVTLTRQDIGKIIENKTNNKSCTLAIETDFSFKGEDGGSRHQDMGERGDTGMSKEGRGKGNTDQTVYSWRENYREEDIYPGHGAQGYQVPHYMRSYPPYPFSHPYPRSYSYPPTFSYLYPLPYSQHFPRQMFPQTPLSKISNPIKQEPKELLNYFSSTPQSSKGKRQSDTVTHKLYKPQPVSLSETHVGIKHQRSQEKLPNQRESKESLPERITAKETLSGQDMATESLYEQIEAEESIAIPK